MWHIYLVSSIGKVLCWGHFKDYEVGANCIVLLIVLSLWEGGAFTRGGGRPVFLCDTTQPPPPSPGFDLFQNFLQNFFQNFLTFCTCPRV